jgi:hypothetical protein
VTKEGLARAKANFSYVELSMLKDDSDFSILGIDRDYQGIVFGEVKNHSEILVRVCSFSLLGKSISRSKLSKSVLNSKIIIKIESRNFMYKKFEEEIILQNSQKTFNNYIGISCFIVEYKNLSYNSKNNLIKTKSKIKNFLIYLTSTLSLLTLWVFTQLMFIEALNKYGYRIIYIWIAPNIIFLLAEIFIYENFLIFLNILLLYMHKDLLFYKKGVIGVKSPIIGRRFLFRFLKYFNYRGGALKYFFYSLMEYNKYYSENLI